MTNPPLPPEDDATPHPEQRSSADQEPSMPDQTAAEPKASGHLALDELADLAVGELPSDAVARVEGHLAACETCAAEYAQLRVDLDVMTAELGAWGAEPGSEPGLPAMPVTVAARLDRSLGREVSGDGSGQSSGAGASGDISSGDGTGSPWGTVTPLRRSSAHGPIPLKAPATASYVKQTGVIKIMLAAAVAAVVVGFGGYVVSATAGLNEPSSLSPTQVQPAALASEAAQLAEKRNLDPHLFSAAWRCARTVTTGRITGITPVYVGGEQNYLVYSRAGGITYATLVTGCGDGSPQAGDRVRLSE